MPRSPDARLATLGDAAELLRLINGAYQVEAFFVLGERITADEIEARLAAPAGGFLVVDSVEPGSLAGAIHFEIHGGRGHFGLLAVDPDHQHQGLGRRLVAAVEARCRAAGCRALDLEVVNLRTELPGLYAALGFTRIGTAPFPDPHRLTQPAHLLLMTKELERFDASDSPPRSSLP